MIQACFLLALYVAGILFALPFRKGIPFTFLCVTAFLWGSLWWVLCNVIVQLSRVPNTTVLIGVVAGGAALILLVLILRRGTWRLSRSEATALALSTILFAGLSFAVVTLDYTVISYDSYFQMRFGTYLGEGMNEALMGNSFWASWGVFIPALHAAAPLLRIEYLGGFQPALWVSFMATFYYVSVRAIRSACVAPRFPQTLAVLSTLALCSSYFVFFQAFYIHNSLATAVYFFLFCVTAWFAVEEDQPNWLVFAMLALTAFSLCRLENPLYVPVFLAILFAVGRLSYRRQVACALPVLMFLLAWHAFLAYVIGRASNIIDRRIVLLMLAGLGAYAIWVLLSGLSWVRKITLVSHWLMLGAATAVLIGLFAWKPQHMTESLRAIIKNMVYSGLWSSLWVLLVVLCVFAAALPAVRSGGLFTHSLAVYLIAILGLAAGRIPYRLGFGDSGNRMLTHLAPTLLFYLQVRYANGLLCGASLPASSAKPRGLLLAGELTVLLAGAVYLYESRPVDYAIGAGVTQAPGFVGQRYDFSVALRGVVDDRYVAAAGPGPAIVVLDLGKKVMASVLEVVEYRESQRFTDFGWHVSPDGRDWSEVYDTRTSPGSLVKRVAPCTCRYSLHDKGAFRYVRLTFRASAGQNRLLMRKMSLYRDPPQ